MSEGPWNFFKDLVIFKEPSGFLKPTEITFDVYEVWIQLHNLPLAFLHHDIIHDLGGRLGRVCEVDTNDSGHCVGKFSRVRVSKLWNQPLQKGLWVKEEHESEPHCIILKYVKLPNFCFVCGQLGHVFRECVGIQANKDELEFGGWLRATPSLGKKNILLLGILRHRGRVILLMTSPKLPISRRQILLNFLLMCLLSIQVYLLRSVR